MRSSASLLGPGLALIAGGWRPAECISYYGGESPHRLVRLAAPAWCDGVPISVAWVWPRDWRPQSAERRT